MIRLLKINSKHCEQDHLNQLQAYFAERYMVEIEEEDLEHVDQSLNFLKMTEDTLEFNADRTKLGLLVMTERMKFLTYSNHASMLQYLADVYTAYHQFYLYARKVKWLCRKKEFENITLDFVRNRMARSKPKIPRKEACDVCADIVRVPGSPLHYAHKCKLTEAMSMYDDETIIQYVLVKERRYRCEFFRYIVRFPAIPYLRRHYHVMGAGGMMRNGRMRERYNIPMYHAVREPEMNYVVHETALPRPPRKVKVESEPYDTEEILKGFRPHIPVEPIHFRS